jgi:hypothetical protein
VRLYVAPPVDKAHISRTCISWTCVLWAYISWVCILWTWILRVCISWACTARLLCLVGGILRGRGLFQSVATLCDFDMPGVEDPDDVEPHGLGWVVRFFFLGQGHGPSGMRYSVSFAFFLILHNPLFRPPKLIARCAFSTLFAKWRRALSRLRTTCSWSLTSSPSLMPRLPPSSANRGASGRLREGRKCTHNTNRM